MTEVFDLIFDSDIKFFRYAIIAGILSSISFGILGSLVVTRRVSYIAGSISHCVLGGIGFGIYLQNKLGMGFFTPTLGAYISAILAALIIGFVKIYFREREDTLIGAVWALGMAIGLIFIAKTPGHVDPMSYLFGNILMVSKHNLWMITLLGATISVLSFVFYNKLLAVCFDEEFAKLRGVQTNLINLVFLCFIAVTVVILVHVVGIIMVIALLTLPAAVAGQFSRKLWHMMLGAVVVCMLLNVTGIILSYMYDLPSGPTIIVFSTAIYLVTLLVCRLFFPR